ncbi:phenazine biosynthesis protein-like protein phzf family [Massariosphaeria phaeospora]|uniref:Phenazine biosynthesis protein-like protein phzf family n=1 Tax=Massariosphaeria phaeospora TaxID=100035 RepID=A0A7C8I9N1_9PLEO|nr:phenazine biosynthesis protein-like protein phzf family [Massariosphaeria phaeospora]
MQLHFTTLDVFTSTRYIGNPLAVVRVPSSLRSQITDDQKQKIAREFNFSETTFLHEPASEAETVDFDIFTPRSRMTFAGLPTMGTAIYVINHRDQYPKVKRLRTIAGVIPFEYDAAKGMACVAIPHNVREHQARLPHPFPGPDKNATASTTVPLFSIVKGMAFNLVPMADLDALALPSTGLIPVSDIYKRQYLDPNSGWDIGYTGSYYYCDLGFDPSVQDRTRLLRTRGIAMREDPGTGSASAALCCYLALRESAAKGEGPFKYHLTQGVEMGRRCDMFVDVVRTEDGKRIQEVKLSAPAVEVIEGVLNID